MENDIVINLKMNWLYAAFLFAYLFSTFVIFVIVSYKLIKDILNGK